MTNNHQTPANKSDHRSLRVAASPRARRQLRQLGIDPSSLRGSGPGGRIVEADVLRASAEMPAATGARTVSMAAGARTVQPVAETGTSSMRRAVARLTSHAATIPQFHLRAEVDATALVALREQLLDRIQADVQVRLSFTDLLLRAQALALRDFAAARAVWHDDGIQAANQVDMGLVVSVPGGLVIPILRQADVLTLGQLARRRSELVTAARSGRSGADSLQGSVSSLSNLGHTRVDEFSPLIAPPQSTMLAVGRLAARPMAIEGRLEVRPTLRLTLAVDHRVLDGAEAAEFLGTIVSLLERPTLLLYP